MAEMDADLQWSAGWNVVTAPTGAVILHAGPDRSFEINGLDHATVSQLLIWEADDAPIRPATPNEHRLADRLVDIGAIAPPKPAGVGLVGDGAEVAALRAALADRGVIIANEDPDLIIVLRGRNGWPTVGSPHLAVDSRYHHTIVIGPYVIPGRSTCTGCLDGRIERRWPRFSDPNEPVASTRPVLLAELLTIQIDLIQRGISPLVNGTIAWDLEQGRSEHTTVLKVPGCTTCETSRPDGRLALPLASQPAAPNTLTPEPMTPEPMTLKP